MRSRFELVISHGIAPNDKLKGDSHTIREENETMRRKLKNEEPEEIRDFLQQYKSLLETQHNQIMNMTLQLDERDINFEIANQVCSTISKSFQEAQSMVNQAGNKIETSQDDTMAWDHPSRTQQPDFAI